MQPAFCSGAAVVQVAAAGKALMAENHIVLGEMKHLCHPAEGFEHGEKPESTKGKASLSGGYKQRAHTALEQPHPAQGLQVMQRLVAGDRALSHCTQTASFPKPGCAELPAHASPFCWGHRAGQESRSHLPPQCDLLFSGNIKQIKSPKRRSSVKKRAADLRAQGNLYEFQPDRNVLAAGTPMGVTWHQHSSAGAFASLLRRAPCPGRGSMCDSLFTHSPCPEATPKHISCHVVLQRDVSGPGFVPCFALLSSSCMHA